MSEQDRVRVAISMAKNDYDEIKKLADEAGESFSGYLRRALSTDRYIKEREREGDKIIIEGRGGTQREVVFR